MKYWNTFNETYIHWFYEKLVDKVKLIDKVKRTDYEYNWRSTVVVKNIITIQHTQSIHHTNGMVGSWTDWDITELGIS